MESAARTANCPEFEVPEQPARTLRPRQRTHLGSGSSERLRRRTKRYEEAEEKEPAKKGGEKEAEGGEEGGNEPAPDADSGADARTNARPRAPPVGRRRRQPRLASRATRRSARCGSRPGRGRSRCGGPRCGRRGGRGASRARCLRRRAARGCRRGRRRRGRCGCSRCRARRSRRRGCRSAPGRGSSPGRPMKTLIASSPIGIRADLLEAELLVEGDRAIDVADPVAGVEEAGHAGERLHASRAIGRCAALELRQAGH